jgi:hypothetical protein
MKKNYLYRNTNRLLLLLGFAVTAWLSSCKKDTSPGSVNFGDSPALVGFQYYGFNAVPITTKVHGTASDTTDVEVTLSVKTITQSTAVTVTIAPDPTDAAAYVAAQNAAATPPGTIVANVVPAGDYSLANGGVVTIKPGQQIVNLKVSIKGDQLDYSSQPVIALKITDAGGVLIASNLNVAILAITLQSAYEGDYSYKGFIFRDFGGVNDPTLGGNFSGYDAPLPTVSADVVSFIPLWNGGSTAGGIDPVYLAVNPATNAVTITSGTNATLTNNISYNSRYDPASKTFYVSFGWGVAPNDRRTTDTLVYKGPL